MAFLAWESLRPGVTRHCVTGLTTFPLLAWSFRARGWPPGAPFPSLGSWSKRYGIFRSSSFKGCPPYRISWAFTLAAYPGRASCIGPSCRPTSPPGPAAQSSGWLLIPVTQ